MAVTEIFIETLVVEASGGPFSVTADIEMPPASVAVISALSEVLGRADFAVAGVQSVRTRDPETGIDGSQDVSIGSRTGVSPVATADNAVGVTLVLAASGDAVEATAGFQILVME
jgi:hypothetical protein